MKAQSQLIADPTEGDHRRAVVVDLDEHGLMQEVGEPRLELESDARRRGRSAGWRSGRGLRGHGVDRGSSWAQKGEHQLSERGRG